MTTQIEMRKAEAEEIGWINAQYDEIGFKHSDYHNEYIAIAECDGERIGIGRLQHIADGIAELGGIFVKEQYRGLGAAHNIVRYLLDQAHNYKTIYCIPFSHLERFYRQFGFERTHVMSDVPTSVIDKYHWCNATYEQETLLFVIHRSEIAPQLCE